MNFPVVCKLEKCVKENFLVLEFIGHLVLNCFPHSLILVPLNISTIICDDH